MMVAAVALIGLIVGVAVGLGCAGLFGPVAVAAALDVAPAWPTTLERFLSHPPPRGATELAEEIASVIDNDGLAVVAARYAVEAYGRGVADLHAALVENSGLPRDVADEACAIAIQSMGVP